MASIPFVHGTLVRDGGWWWRPVADLLESRLGVSSRAVALPSCGEGAAAGAAGLAEDAAALTAALEEIGDAVVVAHSCGGTVAAEGADHPALRHLLYITSYLPEVGQAQAAIMSGETNPVALAPDPDGTVAISGDGPDAFGDRFLQDVPDASVPAGAWDRLTPQSVGAFGTPRPVPPGRGPPPGVVRSGGTCSAITCARPGGFGETVSAPSRTAPICRCSTSPRSSAGGRRPRARSSMPSPERSGSACST